MIRKGHLEQVYHIFGYMKQRSSRRLFNDTNHPSMSEERFTRFNWEYFIGGAIEPIPLDMPDPRGEPVLIHVFVDSYHAYDKVTRQSQTGGVVFYQ